MDTCRTCGKALTAPYRVYDSTGHVVQGCISADHDGQLVRFDDVRWHNRRSAKQHRTAVRKSGGAL